MKTIITLTLLTFSTAFAEEIINKEPSVEQLKAKISYLEAQLAQTKLECQYQLQVANSPDVILSKANSVTAGNSLQVIEKKEVTKPADKKK